MFNRSKHERGEIREDTDTRTTPGLHEADTDDRRVVDADSDDRRVVDADSDDRRYVDEDVDEDVDERDRQLEMFGGTNWGAGFFGWIVAVGMAILLSGIIGAIAAAVGDANDVTQSDLERSSGTIGITAAIVLLVVLLISYYAGGYVAGRMSRFSGARQGLAVWWIGIVVMLVAAALGWIFGDQYNIMDRVDIPDVPIPSDDLTVGGAVTIAAAVVVTLLAAVAGGKAGTHYHRKVDRAL